jgi:hypothetical protein
VRYNVRDEKGRFCKKSDEKVTKGYKGFRKGLICLDKKYEVGETYAEHGRFICAKGMMHFCENPLDVLNYYPVVNPDTGELNEFAEVEALGSIIKGDSKAAANKLRIVKKIDLRELIRVAATSSCAQSDVVTTAAWSHAAASKYKSHAATTESRSNAVTAASESRAVTAEAYSDAATTGNYSSATTVGGHSHAVTAGADSQATTVGAWSNAVTAENWSNAVTAGKCSRAATTGDCSDAITAGYRSHAATTGDYSKATTTGSNSIAAALGIQSKAKAALGNWIVLAEYVSTDVLSCVKATKVDGTTIKPNTFYKLENGEFVEA